MAVVSMLASKAHTFVHASTVICVVSVNCLIFMCEVLQGHLQALEKVEFSKTKNL